MSSWWSWRSLFSSLGNGGGSNADASSSHPAPEAQQAAAAGAARRRSARTKKPREGPAEGEAEPSQPPPKTKAQLQLGDGEPKKKPAPSPTPTQKRNNKRKRVAAFERSWSRADELRILEAMAKHANTNRGALPDTSDLFAALASSLDRRDADLPKLADKIHKLKRWYDNARLLRRCPTDDDDDDDDARQLFQLCGKVWGAPSTVLRRSQRQHHKAAAAHQGNVANLTDHVSQQAALKVKENKVKNRGPYVRRELAELSVLYPTLAELIRTAFQFIGDDEARHLDARYRKMLMDKLNMKMEHADITRSLLCTLAGFIN
uniref:Glabrous enhancer-binding protein-like DBD domain-containing protein n=1 Tax=Oryza punctata TaxID=4537 RepID=A0A0E0LY56_ORYPU